MLRHVDLGSDPPEFSIRRRKDCRSRPPSTPRTWRRACGRRRFRGRRRRRATSRCSGVIRVLVGPGIGLPDEHAASVSVELVGECRRRRSGTGREVRPARGGALAGRFRDRRSELSDSGAVQHGPKCAGARSDVHLRALAVILPEQQPASTLSAPVPVGARFAGSALAV